MKPVNLTITFTDDDGTIRSESRDIEMTHTPDLAREHTVAHILFTELKVTVGQQELSKHNAIARGWLEFPTQPINRYFDMRNSQAVWFELARLVMRVEADLVLAQTFKRLEPSQEPSFEDTAALNDLYYVHQRKMMFLNQSAYALIKVQELVNRLLHESLGGDLVDTSKPDWERSQLLRSNVEKGLEAKRVAGLISQPDFDAISEALKIPKNTPKGQVARTYRNRLIHHIRPSVDYSWLFSYLEPRAGEEIRDAQGKVIGTRRTVSARPPVQYRFQDLHGAFSEYLHAVVTMLQQLSQIDILRR
ncbi:MAG: hypothetical protein ACLQOO_19170 [Terriglobia bacterium]